MNKSERKRMLCVSLAAGAILLCGVLLVLLLRYQHTSTVRPQDQYVGQISAIFSTEDEARQPAGPRGNPSKNQEPP